MTDGENSPRRESAKERAPEGMCRSTLIKEKLPLLAYFGDFCASI